MLRYRVYCLDAAGRIDFAEVLLAADDSDAVVKARATHNGARKCEIWQGKRLVASLDVDDLAS